MGTALLCATMITGCKGGKEAESKPTASKPAASKPAKRAQYTEGAVSNGGTVTGTISHAGATKDPVVKVTKDNAVCGSGETAAGVVTGKDGGLANALVEIQGITSGKAWTNPGPTVDNIKCVFVPRFAVGKLGAEMIAKNSDPVLHNTHLYLMKNGKAKNLKNIALPNEGQTIPFKMKKPGLMDVRCDAHEWMQGWVWVSAHPYVAITDDAGKFTIDGVPPGDYSARIWHEKLGEATAKVMVAAGGSATMDHSFP